MLEAEKAQEGGCHQYTNWDDGFEDVQFPILFCAFIDGGIECVYEVYKDDGHEDVKHISPPNAKIGEVLKKPWGYDQPQAESHQPDS